MSFPGRSPACAGTVTILFLAAVMLLIGSPAVAALVITNVSFSPVPPLMGGDEQHAVMAIAVIPAGATTFSRTHTLQMQTSLTNARWSIQIMVDDIPAAQQPASGTSAFVNGYLLSYPTTSDVSLTVALDGTVPLRDKSERDDPAGNRTRHVQSAGPGQQSHGYRPAYHPVTRCCRHPAGHGCNTCSCDPCTHAGRPVSGRWSGCIWCRDSGIRVYPVTAITPAIIPFRVFSLPLPPGAGS